MWWPTAHRFMRPDGTHVDSLWFKLERAARRGIVTARRGRGEKIGGVSNYGHNRLLGN